MSLLTPPARGGGKTPGRTPGCEITGVSSVRRELSRSSWSRACFYPFSSFLFQIFSPRLTPLSHSSCNGWTRKGDNRRGKRTKEESVIKRTVLQQFRLFKISHLPCSFPVALLALCLLLNMLHCQDGGRRKRGKENLSRDKSVLDPPSPIPNLEVKQYSVHGTTAARLWESRPLRGDLFTLFLLSLSLTLG
jgi:hypothetical protein